MTQYAIMTPDLSSYYHSPGNSYQVREYYDSIQDYVTKEGSNIHRAVLVSMKNVRDGFELKLLVGGGRFRWKPTAEWRFSKSFRWFNFQVSYSARYRDAPDKIIKDHYADQLSIAVPSEQS